MAVPLFFAMTFALAAVVGLVFAVLAAPVTFAVAVWIVPPDPRWGPRAARRARRERGDSVTMVAAATPITATR